MIKKTLLAFFVVIWLLFGAYLLLPAPTIPELPNSLKSDEPGDTVQVANIAAYFNDYSREYVTKFYKDAYSYSPFYNLRLPIITLVHPPEYAQVRVRDQIKAWYFEEYVHPFRESLYVVGWTPALKQASTKIKYQPIIVDNRVFYQKTTVRTLSSTVFHRLGIYLLLTTVFIAGYYITNAAFHKKIWD